MGKGREMELELARVSSGKGAEHLEAVLPGQDGEVRGPTPSDSL
jgi:hypothetical protein